MWKNWIPFRRKQKDDVKREPPRDNDNGKENEEDGGPQFEFGDERSARGPPQSLTPLANSASQRGSDFGSSTVGSFSSFQQHSFQNGNDEVRERKRGLFSTNGTPSRTGSIRQKRPGRTDSFSAVHGPLLSTPITPKVRRVIETQSGLRSPNRSSLLARGRPIGRSASLNHGPSNPAQSKAGQVPWVRLKRRESVALADIVKGRATHSPNTIKIAAPEPSHLLPAPSFKMTPLIVTTEANRSRIIDTQTVVSALREKRKRIGCNQPEDIINDDMSAWQNSAKRRRQDSSQSNASSVSIPPMPETLPNLMSSSDTSILHIENMSNRRPSTVPSIDAFVNRHVHDVGLGGEQLPNMQPLHLPKQYPPQHVGSKNSSKLTQRALQSSLSSSMRARNNLSLLERSGIDLSRIRSNSTGISSDRRASFSSDVSMLERSYSVDNSVSNSRQHSPTSANEPSLVTENTSSQASAAKQSPSLNSVSTVSAPTKRKIAEGVMLRKQNLIINSSNSPLRTQKSVETSRLVGTVDLEQDRNKEYQRRVLDILLNDDAPEKSTTTGSSDTVGGKPVASEAGNTSPPATFSFSSASSSNSVASSAATSAAVSASLDSLNKLIQATTQHAQSPLAVTSNINQSPPASSVVSSLPQPALGGYSLIQATTSGGSVTSSSVNPAGPPSLLSSMLSKQNNPAVTSILTGTVCSSTSPSGFTLGVSAPSLSSSAGFQVNFGGITSTSGIASTSGITPATSLASTTSSSSSSSPMVQFNFGSSAPSSLATPPLGQASSASTVLTSTTSQGPKTFGITSSPLGVTPNFNLQPSPSGAVLSTSNAAQSTGLTPAFSFGSQSSSQTVNQISTAATSISVPGGFNFGLATTSSTTKPTVSSGLSLPSANPGGFNFGPTSAGQSITNQAASATTQAGGFNFNFSSPGVFSNAGATQFSAQLASASQANTGVATVTTATSVAPSTAPAPNITLQPQGIFGGAVNPPTAAPTGGFSGQGFNFGSTQPPQTQGNPQSTTVQASSPFTATTSQAKPMGGFNFGQATTSAPSSNLFTFGVTPASSTSGFGVGGVSSTTGSGPAFGGVSSTTGSGPAFGGVSSTTGSGPAFGGVSSTNAQPPPAFTASGIASAPSMTFGGSTSSFGSSTATTSAPAFGAASSSGFNAINSSTSQPSAFGATTSASSSPFIFGAQPKTTQPPAFGTNPSSAFGNNATANTNAPTIFGSNPSTPNTTPFGSSVPSGVTVFGAQSTSANPTSPPSVFGSSSSGPSFGSGSGQTGQPGAFGSMPMTQPNIFRSGTTSQPSIFGSGAASQPTAFGSMATTQSSVFGSTQTTQPTIFGAGAQPMAFGSGTTPQANIFGTGTMSQPTAFGTGTTAQPTAFGPGTTSQPSIFGSGQALQSTAFGSGTATQPSTFGSGTSAFGAASPTAPAFGAANQPSVPAFGSGTQAEAKPAFGATNPSGVSVFGAPKPNPFDAASPGTGSGFNFNASQVGPNAAAPNPFNAAATSAAPSGFNFKPATEQAANPPGGFNFAPQMSQPTFQSAVPKPSPGGFNFGAMAGAPPAFNFNATPNSNVFTPPTPNTVQRPRAAAKRPTRRGTRR